MGSFCTAKMGENPKKNWIFQPYCCPMACSLVVRITSLSRRKRREKFEHWESFLKVGSIPYVWPITVKWKVFLLEKLCVCCCSINFCRVRIVSPGGKKMSCFRPQWRSLPLLPWRPAKIELLEWLGRWKRMLGTKLGSFSTPSHTQTLEKVNKTKKFAHAEKTFYYSNKKF